MFELEKSNDLIDMSSNETEENVDDETPQEPVIEEKKSEDEIDLKIKMNRWGIAFFIMFAAVISYLMIGAMAALPPFIYNVLDQELLVETPGLLTGLLVAALIFLGLGFYFGWVRKQKETDEDKTIIDSEKETSDKAVIFSDSSENKDKDST
ncbi:MAG: hypothetical protein KAS22_00990 [Candidatus Heimdallarchaeota archaeon]|nr:hypothetical protein [Candidatus Heimdallarchaeota archaeon]MCK5183524.1 hypothetical protein [Candidatus Heimdallarchaeota archaeon]